MFHYVTRTPPRYHFSPGIYLFSTVVRANETTRNYPIVVPRLVLPKRPNAAASDAGVKVFIHKPVLLVDRFCPNVHKAGERLQVIIKEPITGLVIRACD